MEKTIRGIQATAMNLYIYDMYEEIEDEEQATYMLEDWLSMGVPDGNDLSDNINDFGSEKDFADLHSVFTSLSRRYEFMPNYQKYIKKVFDNLNEMLDNPYWFMV